MIKVKNVRAFYKITIEIEDSKVASEHISNITS